MPDLITIWVFSDSNKVNIQINMNCTTYSDWLTLVTIYSNSYKDLQGIWPDAEKNRKLHRNLRAYYVEDSVNYAVKIANYADI